MLGFLAIAATALACLLVTRSWHSIFGWALAGLNAIFYLFFPFGKILALLSGIAVIVLMFREPPTRSR